MRGLSLQSLHLGEAAISVALLATTAVGAAYATEPIVLGTQRELLVDHFLLDRLSNVRLELARPTDRGVVFRFDQPWEGAFCGYVTVIRDRDRYRLYYRGLPKSGRDGQEGETTCYAESSDGVQWSRPELGLVELGGTRKNNVILAEPPFAHNFCPMLDPRPNIPADERFKALAGTSNSGLVAFVSGDGIHWRKLQDKPVITDRAFDSQNVPLWSETEGCFLCYLRVYVKDIRRIARSSSSDFVHWSEPELMEYQRSDGPVPLEHLYTNQTGVYFRAPQLYVATAARFMPGRQAITDQQAAAIHVHPEYYKDISDSVLLTSRGGHVYDRTFPEGFVRPGTGPEDWVSRTNYPVLNIVPTGPEEMSLYVQHNYGQPTAHLRRYTLRLDGFASLRAPYDGGEMVTKLLTFQGRQLQLNYATSAAGSVRVEILDADGQPIPHFALEDCVELIGNHIERAVAWKGTPDLAALAGKPIRLRFVMKDADLYALRFSE